MNRRFKDADPVEEMSRYLAQRDLARTERECGTPEKDEFRDNVGWVAYINEAEKLIEQGAKIVGGILII